MANETEKVNTIAIADIEKISGKTDDNIEKISGLEFTGTPPTWKGSRAIIMGGYYYDATGYGRSADSVQYKTMTTDGDTSEFDDLAVHAHNHAGSGSNGVRMVIAGGRTYLASGNTSNNNTINYMVAASTGSVADAGDLNVGSDSGAGRSGASNGTLCFFCGGNGLQANMEQMNISTTGGSTDAGDINGGATVNSVTSNGDSKFLIIGIGTSGASKTAIDEHNFSTSADSTAYGSVATVGIGYTGGVCATNRVVTVGKSTGENRTRMQFFPVASSADGDTSDSADIQTAVQAPTGTSDGTRGEWYGGEASSTEGWMQNSIQKITIASLSNATDIGDLTTEDSTDSYYEGTSHTMEIGGITEASAQTGVN